MNEFLKNDLLPFFNNPKSIDLNAEYIPLAVVMSEVRNKREKAVRRVQEIREAFEKFFIECFDRDANKVYDTVSFNYVLYKPQKLSGKYTIRLESTSEVKPEF